MFSIFNCLIINYKGTRRNFILLVLLFPFCGCFAACRILIIYYIVLSAFISLFTFLIILKWGERDIVVVHFSIFWLFGSPFLVRCLYGIFLLCWDGIWVCGSMYCMSSVWIWRTYWRISDWHCCKSQMIKAVWIGVEWNVGWNSNLMWNVFLEPYFAIIFFQWVSSCY